MLFVFGMRFDAPTLLRIWAGCLAAIGLLQLEYAIDGAPHGLSSLALAGAGGMIAVALASLLRGAAGARLLAQAPARPPPPRITDKPGLTLFIASFVALFSEVMLIRYAGSQIRIFAFYKNIPLIAAYLGLGMGCWLGHGGARHALAFLGLLLPVAAALSLGGPIVARTLSVWGAAGSSEQILGDVITAPPSLTSALAAQAGMSAFCVSTLVLFALLFALLGRLLGAAFESMERLRAYTLNILGSLAGIAAFALLSYLETPPWCWFLVGLAPLVWWFRPSAEGALAGMLIALAALEVSPSLGHTVWSRYQKLVGIEIAPGAHGNPTRRPGYLINISDVFYQVALDLRPAALAPEVGHPYPHYDRALAGLHGVERALCVGAGSGNDVASALRAQIQQIDAVDIDPAIVAMGRAHHPERPYDDPRVHVMIDDARAAFQRLPPQHYDVVLFGLLDSHTQLAMSSVRLDNYVFTLESLAAVRRLLKPGGTLVLTAATLRPWFRQRLEQMMYATCDANIQSEQSGAWASLQCRVDRPLEPAPGAARLESGADLPTDDWPFLYLPARSIPLAYLSVVVLMLLASIVTLRMHGLTTDQLRAQHGHMFFLGAGFMLMEVQAVNRLALLFGTTWLVSAVTIALVLLLVLAANLTVRWFADIRAGAAYAALFGCLLLSYGVTPSAVQGRGSWLYLGYGLLQLSPVYFAGLIFAVSFRRSLVARAALGANMLGSVLGGWVEYSCMVIGFRSLLLVALAFYGASYLLLRPRRVAVSRSAR